MTIQFTGIAAGGDAVGRDENGRVVFVSRGAPGDMAEVEIKEERKRFAFGRLLNVVSASPQRVTPPCPYYVQLNSCGGCQLQHLNYEAQLAAKTRIVVDAMRGLGSSVGDMVQPCRPAPLPFAYRNKA